MEVKKDTIVEFTFSLVDDEGLPIESTPTNSTAILHGHGSVIRGVHLCPVKRAFCVRGVEIFTASSWLKFGGNGHSA